LFDVLWRTVADMLGTAATAALMRRAAQSASSGGESGLQGLLIRREDLVYRYEVPASWRNGGDPCGQQAMRALSRELQPLLRELTGPVVLRRLDRLEVFRRCGIRFVEEPGR
jgi:hypothetical protein